MVPKCPVCGFRGRIYTANSREYIPTNVRFRSAKCPKCGAKFSTTEAVTNIERASLYIRYHRPRRRKA